MIKLYKNKSSSNKYTIRIQISSTKTTKPKK
jgi:hypothetical protein